MITDGYQVALVETLGLLGRAMEWIGKAPHLPGCAVTYGAIGGRVGKCNCGRNELVRGEPTPELLAQKKREQQRGRQIGDRDGVAEVGQ